MNAIKATWKDGQIQPCEHPENWPDGAELVVEPLAASGGRVGLNESEWRDDAAALADWESWLQTIEPLILTAEEQAAFAEYHKA